MADKLTNTDMLIDGYKKINDLITEFNNTVISGDSSVEAAQARVDADGVDHTTLKERLDTEHKDHATQLADVAINITNPPSPLNGAKSDGTDQTSTIQTILDNYNKVVIPKDTFMINTNGLKPRSNTTIFMHPDAILKMITNSSDSYSIINLRDVENVNIIGGTLEGERSTHTGTTGQHGHCLNIGGSKNVQIEQITLKNGWGDGLYIGEGTTNDNSENISLKNIVVDNNRRNGISIVAVRGVFGSNVKISNTNGQAPECGIDIEPNYSKDLIQNITFVDLFTTQNSKAGVNFAIDKTDNPVSCSFINHVSDNDYMGIQFPLANKEIGGNIRFENPIIKHSQTSYIRSDGWNYLSPHIELYRPTVIVNKDSTATYSHSPISFVNTNTAVDYNGNITIEGLKVIYDGSYVGTGYEIAFQNDSGLGTIKNVRVLENKYSKIARYPILEGGKIEGVEIVKQIEGNNAIPESTTDYYSEHTNAIGWGTESLTLATGVSATKIYENKSLKLTVQNDGTNADDGMSITPPTGETFFS